MLNSLRFVFIFDRPEWNENEMLTVFAQKLSMDEKSVHRTMNNLWLPGKATEPTVRESLFNPNFEIKYLSLLMVLLSIGSTHNS